MKKMKARCNYVIQIYMSSSTYTIVMFLCYHLLILYARRYINPVGLRIWSGDFLRSKLFLL